MSVSVGELLAEYFTFNKFSNKAGWWIHLMQQLEKELSHDSMSSASKILRINTQTIMKNYVKKSGHSTITSLIDLRNTSGVEMESCLSMSIPLTDLPMFKALLLSLMNAEESFQENYLDSLLTTTMSTSSTTVPTPTEAVDAFGGTDLLRDLKRKAGLEDGYQPLDRTGYMSSYISSTENQETSKFSSMEYTKDFLYMVR